MLYKQTHAQLTIVDGSIRDDRTRGCCQPSLRPTCLFASIGLFWTQLPYQLEQVGQIQRFLRQYRPA